MFDRSVSHEYDNVFCGCIMNEKLLFVTVGLNLIYFAEQGCVSFIQFNHVESTYSTKY